MVVMTTRTALLVIAIASTGLSAGLLFGWLVSVIPGTLRVSDRAYIETMQAINVAIINPAFLVPFIGTPAILAAAAAAEWRAGNARRATTLLVAMVTYLAGVIGITMGGNVPLNNTLDRFALDDASPADALAARTAYEGPWNRWHAIRTAAAGLAFIVAVSVPVLVSEND